MTARPRVEPSPAPSTTDRSAGRVLASNTAWRFVAFVARAMGGLVATILVARTLGPGEFGRYQFALAVTLLLSFLVMLGLPKLLVRELARRPEEAVVQIDSALLVTIVAGIALNLLLFGLSGLFDTGRALLVMAGLTLIADSAARIVMSLFWAFERMRYEAVSVGAQEGSFVVLAFPILAAGAGVEGVMFAYLTSRAIGFIVAWAIATRKLHCPTWPRWHRGVVRPLLRACVPFAVDDALSLAYVRIDAVLLGVFKNPRAVGLYQSATNLVLYLNILPRMVNMSMYPQMSRAWPDRPSEIRRLRDASLRMLGAIAVPIAVGSFLLAPRIFGFLYGPAFEPAVGFYQALALIIPFRMLGNTLGTALTSVDRQAQRALLVGAAAAVNLGLNLVLIPAWSIRGAVVATLVTESALFVAYAVLLRRAVGPSCLLSAVAVPGLACVPLAGVAMAMSTAPLAAVVVAAGAAYLFALVGIVYVRMPRPTMNPRALVGAFLAWSG
jgi:O-antigen/teichoic acid export membrane protein